MHNGQIGDYEKIRWQIDRWIPEYLYGERRGSTDSEAIFLLMIANLAVMHKQPIVIHQRVTVRPRGRRAR